MSGEHEVRQSPEDRGARGPSLHVAGCDCTRCVGFSDGNGVAVRHGCYSPIRLQPRASEIATIIRSQLDAADAERFSLLLSTAAALAAKSEAALLALSDPEEPASAERLGRDARGWTRLWLISLTALGLTPASAAQLGRDTSHRRLAEHLQAFYSNSVGEGHGDEN